jgi:hypothetical protein
MAGVTGALDRRRRRRHGGQGGLADDSRVRSHSARREASRWDSVLGARCSMLDGRWSTPDARFSMLSTTTATIVYVLDC